MRRSQADSTNRALAAFGKLQHIPTNPCRTHARIPLTFQLTTRIRSASEWSVIVSTGRLRHTHRWSAVMRCQNTGDGVRFRASH